jgi:hypothetical protein
MIADDMPTPEAIRGQLERIFQSPEFRAPDKQRKFLSFVRDTTGPSLPAASDSFQVPIW